MAERMGPTWVVHVIRDVGRLRGTGSRVFRPGHFAVQRLTGHGDFNVLNLHHRSDIRCDPFCTRDAVSPETPARAYCTVFLSDDRFRLKKSERSFM